MERNNPIPSAKADGKEYVQQKKEQAR